MTSALLVMVSVEVMVVMTSPLKLNTTMYPPRPLNILNRYQCKLSRRSVCQCHIPLECLCPMSLRFTCHDPTPYTFPCPSQSLSPSTNWYPRKSRRKCLILLKRSYLIPWRSPSKLRCPSQSLFQCQSTKTSIITLPNIAANGLKILHR